MPTWVLGYGVTDDIETLVIQWAVVDDGVYEPRTTQVFPLTDGVDAVSETDHLRQQAEELLVSFEFKDSADLPGRVENPRCETPESAEPGEVFWWRFDVVCPSGTVIVAECSTRVMDDSTVSVLRVRHLSSVEKWKPAPLTGSRRSGRGPRWRSRALRSSSPSVAGGQRNERSTLERQAVELERERLRAERLEVERRAEMVADGMEVKPPNRYVPIRDGGGAVSVPYRASSNARRAGCRGVIEVPFGPLAIASTPTLRPFVAPAPIDGDAAAQFVRRGAGVNDDDDDERMDISPVELDDTDRTWRRWTTGRIRVAPHFAPQHHIGGPPGRSSLLEQWAQRDSNPRLLPCKGSALAN